MFGENMEILTFASWGVVYILQHNAKELYIYE